MIAMHKLLPPLALVSALALVPVTASSFAAADTTNYQELEKFMSVYQQVKQRPLTLIERTINIAPPTTADQHPGAKETAT